MQGMDCALGTLRGVTKLICTKLSIKASPNHIKLYESLVKLGETVEFVMSLGRFEGGKTTA